MRESGAVIVPCIADDLTDVIYLTSCHLVAHDHVSNHHTSTADRVLAGNHLLVGAAYHEDVEPQFIVERPVDLVELSNDRVPADFFTLGHKSDMCECHLGHRLQQEVCLTQVGDRFVVTGEFKVLLVCLHTIESCTPEGGDSLVCIFKSRSIWQHLGREFLVLQDCLCNRIQGTQCREVLAALG